MRRESEEQRLAVSFAAANLDLVLRGACPLHCWISPIVTGHDKACQAGLMDVEMPMVFPGSSNSA